MENSIVFNNPIVLLGYIIVLAMCVIERAKKGSRIVSVFAVLIFAVTTVYALLAGASLYETGVAAALFFAIRIWAYRKEEEE